MESSSHSEDGGRKVEENTKICGEPRCPPMAIVYRIYSYMLTCEKS
jgi:hypothetical protein